VPVEVGQAGGRVVCQCGTELDVPPLRQLRHLPQAAGQVETSSAGWNVRRGIVTASGILAFFFAVLALWNWWKTPSMPEFDPVFHMQQIDERLEKMTPVVAWDYWVEVYRPMSERGLRQFQLAGWENLHAYIEDQRFLRWTLWAVAAFFAVLAAAVGLWPSGRKSGR
jgi:hypothetical protein